MGSSPEGGFLLRTACGGRLARAYHGPLASAAREGGPRRASLLSFDTVKPSPSLGPCLADLARRYDGSYLDSDPIRWARGWAAARGARRMAAARRLRPRERRTRAPARARVPAPRPRGRRGVQADAPPRAVVPASRRRRRSRDLARDLAPVAAAPPAPAR